MSAPLTYALGISLLLQLGAGVVALMIFRRRTPGGVWLGMAAILAAILGRQGWLAFGLVDTDILATPQILEFFALSVSFALVLGLGLLALLLFTVSRSRDTENEQIRQFGTMADGAPCILWMSNASGQTVLFNQAWLDFTGRVRGDVTGANWAESLHPEDRNRAVATFFDALNARKPFEMEYRLRRWDGQYRWIADTGVPRFDTDGAFLGFLGSAFDNTRRKVAEETLRATKEEAESANRTKSAFLANMSHELRTPLNAIIGFSEIIKNEMFGRVGSPKYRDYANNIYDSAVLLLDLINDVLDFSKAEAGKLQPHDETVDVRELVESTVRLMRDDMESGSLTFVDELPDDLPFIRADARMMKQILINLLSNAVKFTRSGGTITVRAGVEPGPDGPFVLSVRDSGVGIAASDIPLVMSIFGQAGKPVNRRYRGTGLGLPLVKSLVEVHGGVFRLESEPGKGTTASVCLPRFRVLFPEDTEVAAHG